ncbi:uncharacterized protein LOC127263820 [Andrographis paniculata]|uniref:uncharacterized protein LOC127263820 n=1 Tax=Andrographis paniculata TaxID=175694 RepID=UPI0021E823E1|nr:uncharacterized protein LOC127263820 [Andrographis paniculata]
MSLIHYRLPASLHHRQRPLRHPFAVAKKITSLLSMSTSSQEAAMEGKQEVLNQVLKYHNQTKHSFNNYARGPHGLDWANQPNPFRRYVSAPIVPLNHPDADDRNAPPYLSVFNSLPNPQPLSKTTISQLFYNSLALSAWKTTGFSTWSLRVNPSSGNLHPTEAYIISPSVDSLSEHSFVAHYAPKEHALEIRARIPDDEFLTACFPEGAFLIGLSSIFWREAWKYGERAFRYCNHDVGHAIAAISMAAAGLGWDVRVLGGLGYEEMEKLMGIGDFPKLSIPSRPVRGRMPEIEFEHPDCMLLVFPTGEKELEVDYEKLRMALPLLSKLEWKGKPNMLSKEHICWDIIYRTAESVKKPATMAKELVSIPFRSSSMISQSSYKPLSLSEVVRKRRSAVDMDGVTAMTRETFYQILLHCMPSGHGESGQKQGRQLALPFRAMSWDCEVHAVLFVHRVEGLPNGLYFLVRNTDHFNELRTATRSEFKWTKPDGCPDNLPLYELALGDCQELSKRLSCHQDIASDGCFSLGMVAHLEPNLREKGTWMYPQLFWETGVLGQVLYLEAHAVGISATGIGCFFDDPVHEILGLKGLKYQSLYHFTIGGPVLDKRIMSLPAYPGPGLDA